MDSFFVNIFLLNVLFFTCSKHLFLNAFFNGNHFFLLFFFFLFFYAADILFLFRQFFYGWPKALFQNGIILWPVW